MASEKPIETPVETAKDQVVFPAQNGVQEQKNQNLFKSKSPLIGLACIIFLLIVFLVSFVFYKSTTKTESIQKQATVTPAPTISPVLSEQSEQKLIQKVTATSTPAPIHKATATATPTVRIITSTPTPVSATVTPSPLPAATYSISGNVYIDDNQNKSKDGNEQGIAGVTVYFISIGKNTTTDSSGHYSMGGLAPGQYNISPNAPSGYRGEDTNPGFVAITNTDANIDFPFVPN